jgi:hypothetical protein
MIEIFFGQFDVGRAGIILGHTFLVRSIKVLLVLLAELGELLSKFLDFHVDPDLREWKCSKFAILVDHRKRIVREKLVIVLSVARNKVGSILVFLVHVRSNEAGVVARGIERWTVFVRSLPLWRLGDVSISCWQDPAEAHESLDVVTTVDIPSRALDMIFTSFLNAPE